MNKFLPLVLSLIWLPALPLVYMLQLSPPAATLQTFEQIGLELPRLSQDVLPWISASRVIFLAVLASLISLFMGLSDKSSQGMSLSDGCFLVVWNLLLAYLHLAVVMTYFVVFEPLG